MTEGGRRRCKEQQVEARRRAMLLVRNGWREHDIVEAAGVHPRLVQQWKQCQRKHSAAAMMCDAQAGRMGSNGA